MICGVFGRRRCQSAWMDGATSCSWVFLCECACVHLYIKSTRFVPFMKNTNAFFTKETFLTCQKTPKTRAKHNIVKNFVVRNDEKVARRINATPDVTTRPSCIYLFIAFVKFNYVFQPCNDTFQFGEIVPTSYDEYTTLVKSGNVASKHVSGWRVRSKRQF